MPDGVCVVFAGTVRIEDGGDAAVGVVGVGDGVFCAGGVGVGHADQAAGAVVFACDFFFSALLRS